MKSLSMTKKQIIILIVFSFLTAIAAIIHGSFFDLDFSQLQRLTLEGLILTFCIILPGILFLEWIFDINDKQKFDELEERIKKLEKKK